MTPGVWLTSFQNAALPELLRAYADQLQYLYLESPARIELIPFADSSTRWQQAHSGRAFGPTMEIRWQRADTLSIEALLLWEQGHAPVDMPAQRIQWTASDWNARLESAPHPRNVLLADRPESMLRCLDYACEGVVVLTRLCEVIPVY